MKNLIVISLFAILLFACEGKQRYTQQSAEIETIKSIMTNYVNGEWDAYQSNYAEDAQLFFNATEDKPATIQQIIAQQKLELEPLSSYSLDRENEAIEMVLDDKGETWVNYWGVWKGTMATNGKTYEIPIHITSQFVNGKIVKSYGYWDNSPIRLDAMAMQIAAEKAAMEATKPKK
ncbi:nuclear transport factor 2 family protein [Algoriphagus sp.]|jgi:ketosteroid isomerase-like protein|uniref:nuclear transport factor 2 family protein n=1 Tax=Algoriphagus sp. TaxID=1872435 RepID=UPI0027272A4D|nr:nuclear transport factor 2 family protein [Algoriphagus sp.]MDO8966576.1 nuclear transport factor 2 family protein [Algoriphagus sp.]MDP3202022.1 nuclear transport factor 2 family protein [Algoriphagus sp.]